MPHRKIDEFIARHSHRKEEVKAYAMLFLLVLMGGQLGYVAGRIDESRHHREEIARIQISHDAITRERQVRIEELTSRVEELTRRTTEAAVTSAEAARAATTAVEAATNPPPKEPAP